MDMAYTFYLRTSRLDLDDDKKEEEEMSHTSMAGTWMSIVKVWWNEIKDDTLQHSPKKNERVFV
jgi:maltose phosphorylase